MVHFIGTVNIREARLSPKVGSVFGGGFEKKMKIENKILDIRFVAQV
jgi:hypothetical protein